MEIPDPDKYLWGGGGTTNCVCSLTVSNVGTAQLLTGADWTYRPTALRAVGPWLKFIMFSSAYLPSLEIIFESSQKDPYILDFL